MVDIASRIVEPSESAATTMDLFHLFDSPERTPRRETRRARCHPPTLVFGGKQFEVRANLVIEVGVPLPSPEQGQKA
jgi:hypothetical protein